MGQSMRWDFRLLAGETVRFPREEKQENRYYQARQTDAVPLQTEWLMPNNLGDPNLRGGAIVQREKFLFYRGVGTFPPPVTVLALGEGKVRVKNGSGGRVGGLVLIRVHDGTLAFKTLGDLDAGEEAPATLPKTGKTQAELAEILAKTLTARGCTRRRPGRWSRRGKRPGSARPARACCTWCRGRGRTNCCR